MRSVLACLFTVALPVVALAQPPDTATAKKQTITWVIDRQAPTGGFYPAAIAPKAEAKPVASLRATSAAVRSIKYLGGEIPNADKHAEFVLSCFDPATGGFAEPGGKPDVAITSVGVMAAAELRIPKEKYAKAMDYLKAHATTFEEVRIGAAAVEAWGVKECPFALTSWQGVAERFIIEATRNASTPEQLRDGLSRDLGSWAAFELRLGLKTANDLPVPRNMFVSLIAEGQRPDGGWARKGEKVSDAESTYRVMRALMLLQARPRDPSALRKFIASHRNADGGYATKPGDPSSVGGVYYATMVTKWLDEMEKR